MAAGVIANKSAVREVSGSLEWLEVVVAPCGPLFELCEAAIFGRPAQSQDDLLRGHAGSQLRQVNREN